MDKLARFQKFAQAWKRRWDLFVFSFILYFLILFIIYYLSYLILLCFLSVYHWATAAPPSKLDFVLTLGSGSHDRTDPQSDTMLPFVPQRLTKYDEVGKTFCPNTIMKCFMNGTIWRWVFVREMKIFFEMAVELDVSKTCKLTTGLYYKTSYDRNLRIFVISWSVCPWQAFPA